MPVTVVSHLSTEPGRDLSPEPEFLVVTVSGHDGDDGALRRELARAVASVDWYEEAYDPEAGHNVLPRVLPVFTAALTRAGFTVQHIALAGYVDAAAPAY